MVEQTYNVAIGRERKGRERGGGGEVAMSPKEPGWRLQLPFSGSLVRGMEDRRIVRRSATNRKSDALL